MSEVRIGTSTDSAVTPANATDCTALDVVAVDMGPASSIGEERMGAAVVPIEVTRFALRGDLMTAHAVRSAAETGILKRLRRPGTTAKNLSYIGFDRSALDVLLRLLRYLGICESAQGVWSLTEVAEGLLDERTLDALKSSGWGTRVEEAGRSLSAALFGAPPAYEREYGTDFWTDLARSPQDELAFHEHLEHTTTTVGEALARHLDLTSVNRLVDLAGGRGTLSRVLLSSAPELEVVVVDLPTLGRFFDDPTRLPRGLSFHPANMLRDDLPEADVYVLAQVLHDWPDDDVIAILGNVRHALKPGARLLVIDRMAEQSVTSHEAEHAPMSMRMHLMFGARERTCAEVVSLADRAGLTALEATSLCRGFSLVTVAAQQPLVANAEGKTAGRQVTQDRA